MKNYTLPIYQQYRTNINTLRNNKKMSWEEIEFAGKGNDEALQLYLDGVAEFCSCNEIDVDDWKALVEIAKKIEESALDVDYKEKGSMIVGEGQDNDVYVPSSSDSCWQVYKNHLLKQGFKEKTVDEMEKSTLRTLRRLSTNKANEESVKGLVVGNVQSGKTANMAALMSMAADWGWNMFIVLSGTIENLRNQTQTRLLNDLNQDGMALSWHGLPKLSKDCDKAYQAQYLSFQEGSHDRYFTVCLKNSTRLSNLIQWLTADKNKQQQMKILVIDDEADQAGINTKKIVSASEEQERNRINSLIVNLVGGCDPNGNKTAVSYQAMNYIGYTATPYANILNESGRESLYPRNFISTLAVSKEYFGPQQIFGVDGMDYDGMDIVRTITTEELDIIKDIHEGDTTVMPDALKNAICWFLCGSAAMRIWGHNKPVSMLVHTSQKQAHHKFVADIIQDWLRITDNKKIIADCKDLWTEETSRFTFKNFRAQYPDYDREDSEINQYPSFGEIEPIIEVLLKKITNIKLGDEGDFEYHDGVHICIDNCSNNGISEDGMYMRLAYPEKSQMPDVAPAFIVVGGATLSRGLTIEGLISTVFLRSVGQADTLMQMGRWFGYRKGYELLPRIWMTSKTYDQFRFLSSLDQELRDEIYYMDRAGISPSDYGPKVKNTPMYKFIRITAANRMQGAQVTDMDYSGIKNQTILFEEDKDILLQNIEQTDMFIKDLGMPIEVTKLNDKAKNCFVWKDVMFDRIKTYLQSFHFSNRMRVFNDIDSVVEWIEKMTKDGIIENWNIIVAGTSTGEEWVTPYGTIHKVSRTRRKSNSEIDIIDIGVLRGPSDLIADVDQSALDDETKNKLKKYKVSEADYIREKAGLQNVPQLIIYRIDKDSKVKDESENREDLNAPEDIIGICMNIPGVKKGQNGATAVSIRLDKVTNMDEADIKEEANEN